MKPLDFPLLTDENIAPDVVAGLRARFQREAEVLASLNHPHIAQIYGIDESTGTSALVMELVEGEDLAQRIARGPVPLDEALPIARQIAEALEAAHDAGIVHRDLKPANVRVRPDGTVKVLDFGLAKALEPTGVSDRDAANSPTIMSPAMTLPRVILGTAAYMAPEQAKGKRVDKRVDIWAFGCVLYEMLTGRKAFDGEDVMDTITAVMSRQPDWSALPPILPPPLLTMLRRCLEKDPTGTVDARVELAGADEAGAVTLAPLSTRVKHIRRHGRPASRGDGARAGQIGGRRSTGGAMCPPSASCLARSRGSTRRTRSGLPSVHRRPMI